MVKKTLTFADRVRDAAHQYRGEPFGADQLAEKLNPNAQERARLHDFMHEAVTQKGEDEGYRFVGKKRAATEQVAWRILRFRKVVTIADLEELAGMGAAHARRWVHALRDRGIVTRIGGGAGKPHIWKLAHDTVAMPDDTAGRDPDHRFRAHRKGAVRKIGEGQNALREARELLMDGGKACDEAMAGQPGKTPN